MIAISAARDAVPSSSVSTHTSAHDRTSRQTVAPSPQEAEVKADLRCCSTGLNNSSAGSKTARRRDVTFIAKALSELASKERWRLSKLKELTAGAELAENKVLEAKLDCDVTQCSLCRRKCFLSFVRCARHLERKGCLDHAAEFCACGVFSRRRRERRELCRAVSLSEVDGLLGVLRTAFCLS